MVIMVVMVFVMLGEVVLRKMLRVVGVGVVVIEVGIVVEVGVEMGMGMGMGLGRRMEWTG